MKVEVPIFPDVSPKARIGLLVPPVNINMEREFFRSLPPDMAVDTTHMFRSSSHATVESLIEMVDHALHAARTLTMTLPDVLFFGCTSATFVGGKGWDRKVARRIEDGTGVPTLTTATAAVKALKAVSARRMALATPYVDEVNAREIAFLEGNGFTVASLENLGLLEGERMGRATLADVYELAIRADRDDADALFIACTNLRTLEAIGPIEEALGKPVISANLASLWHALDHFGMVERFAFGSSRLFIERVSG